MTDSNALRKAIKSSGLKYCALAQAIGITTYSLQKKINNVTDFKASEIAVLAKALDLKGEALNRIFFTN